MQKGKGAFYRQRNKHSKIATLRRKGEMGVVDYQLCNVRPVDGPDHTPVFGQETLPSCRLHGGKQEIPSTKSVSKSLKTFKATQLHSANARKDALAVTSQLECFAKDGSKLLIQLWPSLPGGWGGELTC